MKKIISIILFVGILIYGYISTYGLRLAKMPMAVYSQETEERAARIKRHVYVLSNQIGPRNLFDYENLQKAAQYIMEQFQKAGFELELQDFTVDGKTVSNIIAQKKGTKHPDKKLIIGASYDSYFSPGADTNASGCAALIELAEIFAKESTGLTLRLVAFANKNAHPLNLGERGSAVFVNKSKLSNEKIEAAIILDSLGFFNAKDYSQRYPPILGSFAPDKGHFISFAANLRSLELLRVAESVFVRNSLLPIFTVSTFDFIDSDHIHFWKNNIPAILVTDTGPYRNPHYQSLNDVYKTLDYRKMATLVEGLASVIRVLTN